MECHEAIPKRVRTTAMSRNRRIALRKPKYAPAGDYQNECLNEARRATDATLQACDVVANDAPAATALPYSAPVGLDAAPAEVL